MVRAGVDFLPAKHLTAHPKDGSHSIDRCEICVHNVKPPRGSEKVKGPATDGLIQSPQRGLQALISATSKAVVAGEVKLHGEK